VERGYIAGWKATDRLPNTSLYGRIFAIFWFTIVFSWIMAVLTLPHLESR